MSRSPPDSNSPVHPANAILRGESASPDEMLELAKALKKTNSFGLARRLLARARSELAEPPTTDRAILLRQQHAVCTYKDPDLPAEERLDTAYEILSSDEDLSQSTDPESLGIAGAIDKRRWQLSGDKEYLERAALYYARGHAQGPDEDFGYTGINAAFVLDQLAALEERGASSAGSRDALAEERRSRAAEIRRELLDVLPGLPSREGKGWLNDEWWFLVTVAEAHYGLREYDQAAEWLRKASALERVDPWEFESTARQLAALARLQVPGDLRIFIESEAGRVLSEFLGDRAEAVQTAYLGKLGLALSGGGFRAALFHVGVLARLAELDVLRHVEALSCVSGGSIVGAHYYLELRRLLESKPDAEIERGDYIGLVQRLVEDFTAGVQRNIRTRVAAELTTNLRMIFWPGYSRTKRVGELYEECIYRRVAGHENDEKLWLNELFVRPKGEPESFSPRYGNWHRRAKVPVLVLNTTSLNTGHSWQFTASFMGEPPAGIQTDVDTNERLRRLYYCDAPEPHQRFRLGHAVAASSCVPGLFEPLPLKDLYPDGRVVRLVDGGVHDNQGIASLFEQDCSIFLVSDASGQMESEPDPGAGLLAVPLRSNSILMARVREAEYLDARAQRRSSRLRGFLFVHLKKDLAADPVDWIDCQDPYEAFEEARPQSRRGTLTSYGIRKSVQRQLAAVRTDLDSFSDTEAYALMTSGYRMVEKDFAEAVPDFPSSDADGPRWRFLAVEPGMKDSSHGVRLDELLAVSNSLTFKVWKLWLPLRVASRVLAALGLALAVWLFWTWWGHPLLKVSHVGWFLLGLAISAAFGKWVLRIVRFRETLSQVAVGVVMALGGFLLARLHLHVFDRIFLRLGRVPKPAEPEANAPPPS